MKKRLLIALLLLGGIAHAQSVCDHALSFPGFNSYVDCGPGAFLQGEGQFTTQAWVNLTNPTLNQKIAGNIDPFSNSGYILGVENGQLYCEVKDSTGFLNAFHAGTITANTWTHLAFTYKVGGTFKGYINGNLVVSQPVTSIPIIHTGTTHFIIGAAPWDQNYFDANGLIDEVRVYSQERTVSQIRQDMRLKLQGPATGLIGSWSFSEGVGTSTLDRSGYNNNGALAGSFTVPTWQVTDGPYGEGEASLQVAVGTGPLSFPGTWLNLTFNTMNIADTFVVTHINCAPNVLPSGSVTYSDGYWVLDHYGPTASYVNDFHFMLPSATVDPMDELMPSNIRLYNRAGFVTSSWLSTNAATAASSSAATVDVNGVSYTGQFMLGTIGNSTLNLQVINLDAMVEVVPSPASDYCHIQLSNNQLIQQVSLIDLNGRTVVDMRDLNNQLDVYLDVHELAAGYYTLKVSSATSMFIKKIVVNRP